MIELGFVSNKADDDKQLVSDDWRTRRADSMVRAIGGYFARTEWRQGGTMSDCC